MSTPELPPALILGFAFAFGAIVGSFVNVVAHRVPLGLSVVRPRSRCPGCRSPIAAGDNVPILSWVLLGGRCRGCKTRISPRYAVVELLCGLMFAHVAHVLVVEAGPPATLEGWLHLVVVLFLASTLLSASLIDLDHRILPDVITKRGMWVAPAVCAFVPSLVLGEARCEPDWVFPDWPVPVRAAAVSVLGIVVGAAFVWSVGWVGSKVFRKEAMGLGDVKLVGMVGGFAGPVGAFVTLVLGSLLGAVLSLPQMLWRRRMGYHIAFGPFLSAAAYAVLVYGRDSFEWYLRLLGAGA